MTLQCRLTSMETQYTGKEIPLSAPYRATKLWNDIVNTFRDGMPVSRHRRYMKTYENCFPASDAICWLHDFLKTNSNFGPEVTRIQTVQLLQKLHRSRIIEDVRGGKQNRTDFTDNNRLFRLKAPSPMKQVSSTARTPFSVRTDLLNREQESTEPPIKLNLDKLTTAQITPNEEIPECHIVAKQMSAADIEETWKNMTLDRLQEVLRTQDLSDILDSNFVSGKHIMHNSLFINKSGIVTNISPKDQLPHWALSAMKCLAHWPQRVDDSLPSYPGFERDVFRVVKDYFCALPEPLMTYEMYEVILNVFVSAEGKTLHRESKAQLNENVIESMASFESVENLLLNLTNSGPSGKSYRSTPECNSRLGRNAFSSINLSPIHPISDSFSSGCSLRRCESSGNVKYAKYETVFGPENRTFTRVYYNEGEVPDFRSQDNSESLIRMPTESHFDTCDRSGSGKLHLPLAEQCQTMYDVNFARVKSMRQRKSESQHKKLEAKRRRSHGNPSATFTVENKNDAGHSRSVRPASMYSCISPEEQTSKQSSANNPSCQGFRNAPPTYESLYPNGHRPVISGSHRSRTMPRSKSSNSLHKIQSTQPHDSGCYLMDDQSPCTGFIDRPIQGHRRSDSVDSLPGRSLSISDLLHNNKDGLKRSRLPSDLSEEEILERTKDSLQLVCLLLPPANRRKLHLLLKLMGKMANNTELKLDSKQTTRTLILETFSQCILSCQDDTDMEDLLVMRIVSFLMDHHPHIMSVPGDLKSGVEHKLSNFSKTQVSKAEYEKQKLSNSQRALAELLEEIINDKTMSYKDKKKRLKAFQKTYPDIYAKRFPPHEPNTESGAQKPKIKQPLLVKPLLKLKGLRI